MKGGESEDAYEFASHRISIQCLEFLLHVMSPTYDLNGLIARSIATEELLPGIIDAVLDEVLLPSVRRNALALVYTMRCGSERVAKAMSKILGEQFLLDLIIHHLSSSTALLRQMLLRCLDQ